jgi:TolA-binding protein
MRWKYQTTVILSGFLFVAALTTGCLKTRAELEAEDSANQMERQTQRQQAAPYKEKAPPTAYRFEEYDQQMREFSGKIESVEAQNTQLYNLMKAERENTAKEKQLQEQKILALEEAIKKNEAALQQQAEIIAQLKAPPPTPSTTASGKVKNGYEEGEELFNNRKWKEAIVSYQKYRDKNPKGKTYADATYKIGVCFQELGMKDEAKAFFDEVSEKYPKSKEAKKASFRMKSLK